MGATSRGAFPYPDGTDNSKLVRSQIQALADKVAGSAALYVESTAVSRPAPGVVGRFHRATDTGVITYDTGTAWQGIAPKTVRIPHTFTVSGEVKVASGDDFYIPGFMVPVPTGQTVSIVGARSRINSGTSVTFTVRRNGSANTDLPGYVAVSTGLTSHSFGPLALVDGDLISLVVTAVSGTPKNLSVSVFLDYGLA